MPPKNTQQKVTRAAKEGYAYLSAPAEVGSCSFDGGEYSVDEVGLVEVPVAAIPALAELGFVYADTMVSAP